MRLTDEQIAAIRDTQGALRLMSPDTIRALATEVLESRAALAAKDARIARLTEERDEAQKDGAKWFKEYMDLVHRGPWAGAKGAIQAAKLHKEKLETALRFYADVSDYVAPLTGGAGKLWRDCGQVARAALGRDA